MSCNKDLYAKTAKCVLWSAQEIFPDTKKTVGCTPHTFLQDLFQSDEADISETLLFHVLLATTPEQQLELLPFIGCHWYQLLTSLELLLPVICSARMF